MPDLSTVGPAVAAIFAVYLISSWFLSSTHQLKHIPTIGSSSVIFSYLDAFRFVRHGHEMIHEGYEKYYGTPFKVANMSKWLVVVSGPQMIDDIRQASDDQLSFEEAAADTIQTDYTLGRQVRVDTYHIGIVRTPLTRNLAIRFDDITDEISCAFNDLIPLEKNGMSPPASASVRVILRLESEWTTVPAIKTIMKIVCRTSNRLFVGAPLCRNPDYRELNEQFTIDVFMSAQFINLFPKILKPLVGRYLSKVPASIKRAVFHVGPLIEHQLEQEEKYGKNWPDKPNNLISWLIDEAEGPRRTVQDLAIRLLTINFAAIHTSTNALTEVLYNLAAYSQYAMPMREEVEAVIDSEGWTKVAMGKMRKVDSFIKESQRLASSALTLNRKVMKDFTFSNGVIVPAGTEIAAATYSTHMDNQNYDRPTEFQGFRFADMRDEVGESIKHQFVSLTPDFLTFGTGRHACPGRFFAANEIKAMLAFILLNYEVKLPDNCPRPESAWLLGLRLPDRTAQVMFRKRI
ncbi:hypothetical protein GALMADRAFT_162272 [Galerina marginata CBS 339.88]|uniref:Cytochrome P450 n=1 Tax=Galerina marginata (strain CBS 339.88) TaxID=685588 RepID=A0A067S5C3_GALM3|nr:hypothetical protein GALMADRAFT_162272 [Galerina marginata CBS 339.88]